MVPTAPEQKRSRLTLSERAEGVRLLRYGAFAAHLMQKFKISCRIASNTKKNAERILQLADNDARSLSTTTVRHPHFLLVKMEVYCFAVSARSLKYPVTQAAITKRALIERERLLKISLSEEDRSKVSSFAASKGWLFNFIRCHEIRSVASSGKAGSIHVIKVQAVVQSP